MKESAENLNVESKCSVSRIAVRFEGGVGDHLAANRFIPAVKEKYPRATIDLFSDTELKVNSANLLKKLFPSFFKNIYFFPRLSKDYLINTRFGQENYPAHINNLPENIRKQMIQYDKFYDFHIDGLNWVNYSELELGRFFYTFPRPEVEIQPMGQEFGNFALTHLFARKDSDHKLEDWYVEGLLQKLGKRFETVVILGSPHDTEVSDFYKNMELPQNVVIVEPSLFEVFRLASQSSVFIGIDSGLRYIPYHFGKPTFVFSKYANSAKTVSKAHLLRWLIFENNVFPNYYPMDRVVDTLSNAANPLGSIVPSEHTGDLRDVFIKR